jgi:hypothetical protein
MHLSNGMTASEKDKPLPFTSLLGLLVPGFLDGDDNQAPGIQATFVAFR